MSKYITLAFLFIISMITVLGDNYVEHSFDGTNLFINGEEYSYSVRVYNDDIIKVSFHHYEPFEEMESHTIIMEPGGDAEVIEHDSYLQLKTQNLTLNISKEPLSFEYYRDNELIIRDPNGFAVSWAQPEVYFELENDESLYGTGSRAIPQNRRGYKLEMYNRSVYGYDWGESLMNISIPFVVSNKGYALFFDNHYPGSLDLGYSQSDRLHYKSENGKLSYFLISGDNLDEVMQNWMELSGYQPMPPRWTLGYFQSKFGYRDQNEAMAVVNGLRENDFPLDALILDLYWQGGPAEMGNLDWDRDAFPNAEDMMEFLDTTGTQTIVIYDPYFTINASTTDFLDNAGFFGFNEMGESYLLHDFWSSPAYLLDITNSGARDWLWSQYKARKAEGVGGWWSDLGEPELHPSSMEHMFGGAREWHNVYSLIWAKLLFDGYRDEYPQERLFNLTRSGYAGMQRYSTFPWSADVPRSWNGLKSQTPIMLGMSMSGIGYMSSDLGGFTGDEDPELYTRWLQMGAFTPIMRAHGYESVATEPYAYPEPYRSIVRNYIKLRYRMLPYNYSLAYKYTASGRPIVMPLNYFDTDNGFLKDVDDQYLWGEDILVCPIIEPVENGSRSILFPEGNWIDYWNLHTYTGEDIIDYTAPLDVLPVFIKAGSIIPTTTDMQSTSEYTGDSLIIYYYPDPDINNSNYTLFEDDGHTFADNTNIEGAIIEINADVDAWNGDMVDAEITINKTGSYTGELAERHIEWRVQRTYETPTRVIINGEWHGFYETEEEYLANSPAAYFEYPELKIRHDWTGDETVIEIQAIRIDTEVGVEESRNAKDKTWKVALYDIYPNPVTDKLYVALELFQYSDITIDIIDVYGQIHRRIDLGTLSIGIHKHEINCDDLENGSYILRVNAAMYSTSKLFVVNK